MRAAAVLMTVARSCYLPPCGGGRTRSVRDRGKPQTPNSCPILPHKGGGSRRERAIVIREGARGSFGISRRSAVGKRLLHRGVCKPFTVDRHGVALFGHVTAFGKEFLRVVAGIDRQSLRAAAAGELFQRIRQHCPH